MRTNNKNIALTALGFATSILPPLIVTLYQFPGWINTSSRCTVSGIALLFILLSVYPLIRVAKKHLFTPSIPLVWGIVSILVYFLRAIIEQIFIISIVGFVSSCVGWCLFKMRSQKKEED